MSLILCLFLDAAMSLGHEGRVERFALPEAQEKFIREGKFSLDPKYYKTFIWDVRDKTYRDPVTLIRVDNGRRQPFEGLKSSPIVTLLKRINERK